MPLTSSDQISSVTVSREADVMGTDNYYILYQCNYSNAFTLSKCFEGNGQSTSTFCLSIQVQSSEIKAVEN
jgi:hypothetical protein